MKPAEAYSPGEFIQDELDARGWSVGELAARMGGSPKLNELTIEILIHAPSPDILLDDATASQLSHAFGTSKDLWLNLQQSYLNRQN